MDTITDSWTGRMTKQCVEFVFRYDTQRWITMQNWKIGLLHKLIHVFLLGYLVGYVFLQTKSYQEFDVANTSVVTKIKGMLQRTGPKGQIEVWDSTDFVVPSQEPNAFFIATNMIITNRQTQGQCGEDINLGGNNIRCFKHDDCKTQQPIESYSAKYGNGIPTGNCSFQTSTCELMAWCPTEITVTPKVTAFTGFDSITVLVKNTVAFPKFNVKRRNILDSFTTNYLQNCRFHPVNDPICPVFTFQEIVALADKSVSLETMAAKGGIIGFYIDWDCDLNYSEENCIPKYSFIRLDDKKDKVASGWYIRQAVYYYNGRKIIKRDMLKYWGIRFVMLASGRAGRFSYVQFLLHVGSTVSLFGIASFVCELLLFYWEGSNHLKDQKNKNLRIIKTKRRKNLWEKGGSSSDHALDYEDDHDLGNCICMDRRRSSLPSKITDDIHYTPNAAAPQSPEDNDEALTWV